MEEAVEAMDVTAADELSFHVSPPELLNPIWAVESELLLLLEGGGVCEVLFAAGFADEAAGGVLEVEIGEAAADVGMG